METITNAANSAASAATRAIWGDGNTNATTQASESGTEPLSGQTGDVAKGEPYDAGNADLEATNTTAKSTSGVSSSTQERWAPDNTAEAIGSTTAAPGNVPGTNPIRPEHDQEKTGVTSLHQPSSGFSDNKPTSSNQSSMPGPEPSVGADPASGSETTQKQQGAERPTELPKGDEVKAIKKSKEDAEAAQSQGSGTDEKLVKTSGTTADGGTFDAAQAGAGKEADRILETKGIQKESPGQRSPQDTENTTDDAGEKKHGFRAKIKGILHKS